MIMTHPGLAHWASISVILTMLILSAWFLTSPFAQAKAAKQKRFIIGSFANHPWFLFSLKLIFVALFLLIIIAGLFGTPIPARNIATVLTWNIWWAGVIISILFLGSAWCTVCPWDTLAQWLVKRKLWKKPQYSNSLELSVPKWLRNIWPALFLFVFLTWLELGFGTTKAPYATAIISLLMVILATVSLSLFKRKAFCRYFCPVGRTIGFYSQLSTMVMRPINTEICSKCTTLECYHGNAETEACPTGLVMGTLQQNTFCTSCGNCARSCPQHNVAWQLRSPAVEVITDARPHWDEAWFMVFLLALTQFHGFTMLSFWEPWMLHLSRLIGDSGQMLISFSIAITVCMLVVALIYSAFIYLSYLIANKSIQFKQLFTTFAFVNIPLSFSYHMAHNLNHLVREGHGLWGLFKNPLGIGAQPLSMMERHMGFMSMWVSQNTLGALQALLMIFGFWIAIQIIRYRGNSLALKSRLVTIPILLYTLFMTGFNLWMLIQPMTMRM